MSIHIFTSEAELIAIRFASSVEKNNKNHVRLFLPTKPIAEVMFNEDLEFQYYSMVINANELS